LKDLPFVTFYMDDIIVAALDEEDMTQKLKIVFARLAKYNLKIQLRKNPILSQGIKNFRGHLLF
jgi:hypothetical protein